MLILPIQRDYQSRYVVTTFKELPGWEAKFRPLSKLYDVYKKGKFVGHFSTTENKTDVFEQHVLIATTYNCKTLYKAMLWLYLKTQEPLN